MTGEMILGISSVVIALCALYVSIKEGREARRHNILSVRPRLEFVFNSDHGKKVSIGLLNNGLGPGVIKSITATIEGTKYPLNSEDEICAFFKSVAKTPSRYRLQRCGMDDYALGVGEEVTVLSIDLTEDQSDHHEPLRKAVVGAFYEVNYECLYERRYLTDHGIRPNHSLQARRP